MAVKRPVKPGQYVRVVRTAQSPYAGRAGLVGGVAGDVVRVRFAAARDYSFAVHDLELVLDGPRSA
ncbi:MAG: hypothetical protein M0014_16160 [Actinomycetota bacterium]|jgi:hypothetical protein|nr:hypothetical protein [Actinomycetota bacterium]